MSNFPCRRTDPPAGPRQRLHRQISSLLGARRWPEIRRSSNDGCGRRRCRCDGGFRWQRRRGLRLDVPPRLRAATCRARPGGTHLLCCPSNGRRGRSDGCSDAGSGAAGQRRLRPPYGAGCFRPYRLVLLSPMPLFSLLLAFLLLQPQVAPLSLHWQPSRLLSPKTI